MKNDNSKLECAMQCSNLDKCWYFSYLDKECLLYDKLAMFYLKTSNQSFYYEKMYLFCLDIKNTL